MENRGTNVNEETGTKGASNGKRGFVSEFWLFVWEVIKIVVISLVIIIPIRYFIAQPFFVKGASMEPTFDDGDYLIIDEISYRFQHPRRGDVIVFRFLNDESQFFIKRIICLPGETCEIKKNQVVIYNHDHPDGLALDESSYLSELRVLGPDMRIKLDDNEYFVLGDNREQSSDSRYWGPLNRSFIVGRAWVRAWPLNKVAGFTPVMYPAQ